MHAYCYLCNNTHMIIYGLFVHNCYNKADASFEIPLHYNFPFKATTNSNNDQTLV